MMHVKRPVVAGLFYPDSARELKDTLATLMREADGSAGERPHAIIAPHAGYQYSGPIAASAYATLAPWADQYHRVVVLAPSHRVGFRGIATSNAEFFRTPLGDIPVDREAMHELRTLTGVLLLEEAFAQEHALEVQLPFLQAVLKEFELVPLVVGEADSEDVSLVIERLYAPDTLIVVSSDLSHFLDYDSCRERDLATSALIEGMQEEGIGPYEACGAFPVCGLLKSARRHGWRVRTLDLRNSGDTVGDKARVVGYGAYEFY